MSVGHGYMQKFCNGGKLCVGGRSSKQCQREHWKTMFCFFNYFLGGRGDKIDTREGDGPLPRPLNTPIMEINHPQC